MSFCGCWEQPSSIRSDFSEQLALSHALAYLVMHHEKIKVNQSTLHLAAKGFYFIPCKKEGMELGGEPHCSRGQRVPAHSVLPYPTWNIIIPTVSVEKKIQETCLAKGLGSQQHQWGDGGQSHSCSWTVASPHSCPAPRRRFNDDLAGMTIPAETRSSTFVWLLGPFLNTRMVCTSAALAPSSPNWCHQDQHCLKIKGCVNIDYFPPFFCF